MSAASPFLLRYQEPSSATEVAEPSTLATMTKTTDRESPDQDLHAGLFGGTQTVTKAREATDQDVSRISAGTSTHTDSREQTDTDASQPAWAILPRAT